MSSIWDIFKKDPDAVAARQAGRTARREAREATKQAKIAAKTAKTEARLDPAVVASRTGLTRDIYEMVHGSVSEVGSSILDKFGFDVQSQDDRDIAKAQAMAALQAPTGGASTTTVTAPEPGFLDKYGGLLLGAAGLGIGVAALSGGRK